MSIVVVDASAIVEFLLQTERSGHIGSVLQATDANLNVPALCDIEVVAALRRGLLRRRLSAGRVAVAIDDYVDLPLSRHGHQALLGRMIQLSSNFSAYDAAYVALAEQLSAELLTADDGLARAVRRQLRLGLALA